MDTKVCNKCGVEKNIDKFQFRKDTNSYRHTCKECINKHRKILYDKKNEEKRRQKQLIRNIVPKAKICNKCGIEKDISEFEYRKDTKKYRNTCKKCMNTMSNQYYYLNRERIRAQQNEYGKQYRIENKERLSQIGKEYYEKNKEKIQIRHRKNNARRYIEKREEILEYGKEYKKTHKVQIRKRMNLYEKKRKEVDPLFKLIKQVRTLINGSFSNKGYKKDTKTEKILGCDIDFFITYLLETYKLNYGIEWDKKEAVHIDHIIPLATAKSEDEILKLCHYKNLQLLKAKDNLEKNDKLDWKVNNIKGEYK